MQVLTYFFNNISRAGFSYESFACSFFILTFKACIFLAHEYWRKSCLQNIGNIDTLHQVLTWKLQYNKERETIKGIINSSLTLVRWRRPVQTRCSGCPCSGTCRTGTTSSPQACRHGVLWIWRLGSKYKNKN